jgi:hypothetical protein
VFLPAETLEDRETLILRDETIEKFGYDPTNLGRHSKYLVVFKCIVCGLPSENTKKMILDKKGLTHLGECRHQLKIAKGKQARINEDPKYKEIRKQKLKEKLSKDGIEIIRKRQNTLIEKYGSKKFSEIESIRENISKGVKKACLEKNLVQKRQQTNLAKYGSTNFLTSEAGTKIVNEMSLRLFGTPYPFQNKEHRLKAIEYQTRILSCGTLIHEFVAQHSNSKYINRYLAYKVFDELGEQAFVDFCNKAPFQTILEHVTQKLLQASYYNRFPSKELRYKPDFIIQENSKEVYINVDGLYWHSELEKLYTYHSRLRKEFQKHEKRILQFREDEINNKPEIVSSIVANIVGRQMHKFNARSCNIRKVDSNESAIFLENNHLMGKISAITYGLYYQDTLLSVIAIKRKEEDIEIARFGSKNFCNIRGGFSKLLKFVIKKYNPKKIISFCDLRYADGHSYEKLGFKLESISQGWQWTDFQNTFNRRKCRANMDERGLSEREYANEKGWAKIYDAGQAKYVLEDPSKLLI